MPDPTQTLATTDQGDAPTQSVTIDAVENAIMEGDLSELKASERKAYYEKVCQSVGLNPFTKPLEYITLNGRLTLYANKTAANQLRANRHISITKLEKEYDDDRGVYTVRAYAQDQEGRCDVDEGIVPLQRNTTGESLANARMKAITKAKRRVTLSICGLGWLDETELDTIPSAEAAVVDHDTGEITESSSPQREAKGLSDEKKDELTSKLQATAPDEMPGRLQNLRAWADEKREAAQADVQALAKPYADRVRLVRAFMADLDRALPDGAEAVNDVTDKYRERLSELPEAWREYARDHQREKIRAYKAGKEHEDEKNEQAVSAMQNGETALGGGGGDEDEEEPTTEPPPDAISEAQVKRFHAIAGEHAWSKEARDQMLAQRYGLGSSAHISKGEQYEEICEDILPDDEQRARYGRAGPDDASDVFGGAPAEDDLPWN